MACRRFVADYRCDPRLSSLDQHRCECAAWHAARLSAGVIASSIVYLEAVYAQRTSYATAMALTAISVFVLASVMAFLGRERHGQHFGT